MHKKFLTIVFIPIIFCFNSICHPETFWNACKNIFGGELAKKYPNAGNSKSECIKLINDYIKNYAALNKNCMTLTINGKVQRICSAPDYQQLGVSDAMIELYCNPKVREQLTVKNYQGYHDMDNKDSFWIPADVVPLMMTNEQLEKYRIINENYHPTYNMKSPFIQQKIKNARAMGRPLIKQDITEAQKDYKIVQSLEDSLRDSGATGYSVYNQQGATSKLPSLSQEQEKQLKIILDEYGDTIFSDNFKKSLKLYRQRQEYIKNNTPKAVQNVQKLQQNAQRIHNFLMY